MTPQEYEELLAIADEVFKYKPLKAKATPQVFNYKQRDTAGPYHITSREDGIFQRTNYIAIDTETTGLDAYLGDRPFAVSMCNEEGETWYCEWGVNPFTREVYPDKGDVNFIRSIVEDPNIVKVFHNGKFDLRMLDLAFGMQLKGKYEETIFAARVSNSLEKEYGLKYLADKYFEFGREDNDRLLEETVYLRGIASGLGYKIARGKDGKYQDYWLPRHFNSQSTLCQEYAEQDAVRTLMLWNMYDSAMDEERVRDMYDMELNLIPCTYEMETRGVKVNLQKCLDEEKRHDIVIKESFAYMRDIAEREHGIKNFNPQSDAQIVKICKEKNLPLTEFCPKPNKKTGEKVPSVAFNSIRTIADDPFIHQLQRHRASKKVKTTFLKKYIDFAIPDTITPIDEDGKTPIYSLHPMFRQDGAQTGRYSCGRPNLQQVVNANGARNAVESMSARMAFGPRPGFVWYHCDYSQLELYLFAGLADEKFMLNHMLAGHDLHAECANKAWGGKGNPNALIKGSVALELEAEKPTTDLVANIWKTYGWDPKYALDREAKNEFVSWWLDTYGGSNWDIVKAEKALGKKVARTRAKFVMYAKIYGGGPKAIKNFLYCTDREASLFQLEYDLAFPRIKRYIRQMAREAEDNGYITNPYGRKVVIPQGLFYKATNYLVQSTAADLLKDAMRKCYPYTKTLQKDGLGVHLLMTIHDELVFEVSKDIPSNPTKIQREDGPNTKDVYVFDDTSKDSPLYTILSTLQAKMQDTDGRFSVPILVDLERCDARWDQKIPIEL